MVELARRVQQRGGNVFSFEVGIIGKDLLTAFTGGKQFQNIADPDTQAANAGAATALIGIDGDSFR